MKKTLKHVFHAFLKTYIEYGTLAWGGAPKTYLLKTERTIKAEYAEGLNPPLLQTPLYMSFPNLPPSTKFFLTTLHQWYIEQTQK